MVSQFPSRTHVQKKEWDGFWQTIHSVHRKSEYIPEKTVHWKLSLSKRIEKLGVEVRRAALSWCSTTFDLFGAALSWCSTTSRAALPRAALLSKKKICFPYIRWTKGQNHSKTDFEYLYVNLFTLTEYCNIIWWKSCDICALKKNSAAPR